MPRVAQALIDRRRRRIRELLRRQGTINVREVAAKLGVSTMTVRRDLAYFEQKGLVIRDYGGAVNAERLVFEFTFARQQRLHKGRKQRIGRAAVKMVKPGESVILDTGTTTLQIARALRGFEGALTVYTATLPIISELWGHDNVEVVVLGGNVRKNSPDLYGPLTEMMLDDLNADHVFLGAEGVDPVEGFTVSSMEVARMARAFLRAAKEVIVVADSSKFGLVSRVRYARLDEVDGVLTDNAAPSRLLRQLRAKGCKVTTV